MTANLVATGRTASPTPTPSAPSLASGSSLPTAVGIGWLLAELQADLTPAGSERLPSGSLEEASVPGSAALLLATVPAPEVRVRQIQTKLFLLQPDLDRAGVDADALSQVTASLRRLARALGPSDNSGAENGDPSGDGGESHNGDLPVDPLRLVNDVTQEVLANLTAVSTRMGRAFGLGYDLANTCRLPVNAQQGQELAYLFGDRIIDVHEALADLASSLPAHAGRAVTMSLAQWQYWAVRPTLGKQLVQWPQRGVSDALARQGQVWRSVLCGEKLGTDMLAIDDYLGALKALARRLVTGRPWVWFMLFLLVVITGLGIYLLVAAKATVLKIVGIAISALGVVGIRTASLKQGFSDIAKEIEAEVWGAEVDFAIAEAITVPPGDWRIDLRKINTPPPRGLDPHIAANSRTVHRIINAISERRRPKSLRSWRVQKHLHDRCQYTAVDASSKPPPGGAGLWRRLRLARRLVSSPTLRTRADPLKPGAPGRLVSRHADVGNTQSQRGVVWTFHHSRLTDVHEFAEFAQAEAESQRSQLSEANGHGRR